MSTKSGIVVTAVVAALGFGFFAYGQNQEKPSGTTKATVKAATGSDGAKKAGDVDKKPAANPNPAGNKALAPALSDEEKAVRASAEAFTKLYNAHDSKGLGELFAHKAEIIDENEQVVKGREAIQQAFADVFKANPQTSIHVEVESVRVLTPYLAIEEGTTLSKNSPDDIESASTYVAIHAKLDGKWMLACVRDWAALPAELTPHDHLLELGWLVGEWIEESEDSIVHTVCKWHDSDNFLMQEFKVQIGGDIAMSGTMRIGWDAVSKQFKSWVFDSHGGHSEGMWHREGNAWVVKSRGSTAKGETASATNVYRQIDSDTLGWQSTDRVVDGERQDDIEEIVIKRRPPSPQE
jgi:uncharacterized protein (TIGR02246 family)